jgi:hypothetical protein
MVAKWRRNRRRYSYRCASMGLIRGFHRGIDPEHDADEHVDAEGDHHEPKGSVFGLFSVEATSGFTRVAAR